MAGACNSEQTAWFDEIDLDPTTPWLRMGTRQLGDRPWLLVDELRDEELALKQQLCVERHDEVFAAESDTFGPGAEVLELVSGELADIGIPASAQLPSQLSAAGSGPSGDHRSQPHPLDLAGRSVQEDLCLLRREDAGWILAAASLCFPSRWRLADKMGRPLIEVHGPVKGYEPELAGRVDSLFDRLGNRTVWRRNWFIHPNGNLFQPDRPVGGDPTVPALFCADQLAVRSERQTMRTLPQSGWVLFTIRIQQSPVGVFAEERRQALVDFLDQVSPDDAAHRGLSSDQLGELRNYLTTVSAD